MLCEFQCKFDERKSNSDQWPNNDKCQCECKKRNVSEKDYIWNPSTCSSKNRNFLSSVIDDSAITLDEVIEPHDEERETIPTNFNENKAACKTQNVYILLAFSLITLALLMAVSICCYLVKYQAKQKHLLPFHDTNNKLTEVLY